MLVRTVPVFAKRRLTQHAQRTIRAPQYLIQMLDLREILKSATSEGPYGFRKIIFANCRSAI
jgi:hypothetical protein